MSTIDTAKAVYKESEELVVYLFQRWADEWEYENLRDYGIPVKGLIEKIEGVEFIRMTRRPFGFRFLVNNVCFEISLYSDGNYTLKGIKK